MNDKVKLIIAGAIFIVFLVIIRKLTAKAREKRKQTEQIEEYETTTSAKNPFNDTAFIKYATDNKITVVRYTDGGKAKAKELYSYFGRLNEDEFKIIDFFRKLSSQYQVAQISKSLRELYKISLLELLRQGIPTFFFSIGGGLSKDDLTKVFKIVSELPRYKK